MHVAFLRAINVGGRSLVKMSDLRVAFERAGCLSVRTYIQSGNVVFDLPVRGQATVFLRIRRNIRALMGCEPEVVFRTGRELQRIVAQAPFKDSVGKPDVKLYVVFLSRKPARTPVLPLVSEKEAIEAAGMTDREVFIISRPKKNGMYGFPNEIAEATLGVPATSRNWTTVTKILEIARLTAAGAPEPARRTSSARPPARKRKARR
jgi:uncharacterized protein (DUF1697 family)